MTSSSIRRVIHASTGLIIVVSEMDPWVFRSVVWVAAVVFLAFDVFRINNAVLHDWISKRLPVFREREHQRISGASFLWLGYSITVLFPAPAVAVGILAAALADPAASLAGSMWGRGPGKSIAGSAACFVVIGVGALAVGVDPRMALLGAVFGTLIERFSGQIDDNLVLGPGVAATILVFA